MGWRMDATLWAGENARDVRCFTDGKLYAILAHIPLDGMSKLNRVSATRPAFQMPSHYT